MKGKLGLVLLLVIVLVSVTNADKITDLEDTVIEQDRIITEQKEKLIKYETKEKAERIIGIPFTDIAITKDHMQGFIVGGVTVLIIL